MMQNVSATTLTKRAWNRRAARDAFHYVETGFWDGNIDNFFALGEQRARQLIDPVLAAYLPAERFRLAVDLGCGVGRFSRALASRFVEVIGLDVSDEMVERAARQHSAPAYDNLRFIATDGVTLPLQSTSVNFLYSYEVFQHMASHGILENNLKEIGRVLAADGVAFVHFKTGYDGRPILGRLQRLLPTWIIAAIKRLSGLDHLTSDIAFRGARPLTRQQITTLCRRCGLDVLRFHNDPTHLDGSRVFAVVSRPGGKLNGSQ